MTKTMQNWSTIPVELFYMITTYCGRDCKKVKWMFTNKRWYTFYLSQVYHTITTSLDDESVIDKILYSPFDVGKHVKCVNLFKILIPMDLNEFEVHTDILGKIMKRTPNVIEVNLSSRNRTQFNEDWIYFSKVLINVNCWKLQFMPALGKDAINSSAYYYTCAYHLRHTLKRLELLLPAFGVSNLHLLKDFIALKTLEVRKNLINGLTHIETFLQYTPMLKELIVLFDTNRVYLPIKTEYKIYSNLKKLRLYNFSPQNDELLTLIKGFPALESLRISCKMNKIFLSDVDDPSIIDDFFNYINLIPTYKILMVGKIQEICFSGPWLKSNKNGKNIQLLHYYSEEGMLHRLNIKSNLFTTFHGGSTQKTLLLVRSMYGPQKRSTIARKFEILDSQKISCLKISDLSSDLSISLEHIIAKERPYLKEIVISNCTFEDYAPQKNLTSVPRHMKRMVFCNCKLDLLLLKLTLSEFSSLNYVEFKDCTFDKNANIPSPSIDMSDTNVTSMKITNFQKMLPVYRCTDKVQTVIGVSVYFADLRFFRYFSVVENNLFETTKDTYELFCNKFNNNEAVLLNIRVKSLQELSFKLTDSSKLQNITFRSQESYIVRF